MLVDRRRPAGVFTDGGYLPTPHTKTAQIIRRHRRRWKLAIEPEDAGLPRRGLSNHLRLCAVYDDVVEATEA